MSRAVTALLLLVLSTACGGGASDAPEDGAQAPGASVGTADSELGTILVDAEGNALYLFDDDTDGASVCAGDCAATWPALTTDGAPAAEGEADTALLGTTERDDGAVQVTYDGHPLYHFAGDEAPGDLNGHGVGEVWWLVAPAGDAVDAARADTAERAAADGY